MVKNVEKSTCAAVGRTDRQRPVRPIRLLGAAGIWVGLVIIALLNAVFRELVLGLGSAQIGMSCLLARDSGFTEAS